MMEITTDNGWNITEIHINFTETQAHEDFMQVADIAVTAVLHRD